MEWCNRLPGSKAVNNNNDNNNDELYLHSTFQSSASQQQNISTVFNKKENKDVALLISFNKSLQSDGALIAKARWPLVFQILGSLKDPAEDLRVHLAHIGKALILYSGASPIWALKVIIKILKLFWNAQLASVAELKLGLCICTLLFELVRSPAAYVKSGKAVFFSMNSEWVTVV